MLEPFFQRTRATDYPEPAIETMATPEDALAASRNTGLIPAGGRNAAERDNQRGLRLLLRFSLITAALLVLVRVFVLEPYGIPTGSMRPTIIEGDVLLVSKLPYTIRSIRHFPFTQIPIPYLELPGLGALNRGDVIVFEYPSFAGGLEADQESQFVKRCVALRGDTVQLLDGRIRVNGEEVAGVLQEGDETPERRSPIRRARAAAMLQQEQPVVVPYAGYELQLDSVTAERWRPLIESEGNTLEYNNHIVFLNGMPAIGYTFRRDYFFALGDNSRISRDSRFFGFIPYRNLIGKAWMIYWSRDPDDASIRWSRIGTIVR